MEEETGFELHYITEVDEKNITFWRVRFSDGTTFDIGQEYSHFIENLPEGKLSVGDRIEIDFEGNLSRIIPKHVFENI